MTIQQVEQLKNVFTAAREEVPSGSDDQTISDWLMNLGGSLIALGVSLAEGEEDED
jgi:hypothetical protein